MLSALYRKEWRQLRSLRWAGIALGVAMPALAAAGAEAGRRGWLPFGRGGDWTAHEIFAELAPAMVCLFVWPLMALLFAAQSLTADAAGGTEAFLLERPVPRNRVWVARVMAAASSALVLAGFTGVAALGFAWVAVGAGGIDPSVLGGFGAAGLAASALAAMAALPSAALIRSPVGAVLAGLLFAAVPALGATLLGAAFPFATIGGSPLPIGLFVPWLLVIGYVLASRSAETRGEPAGRGRRARAARVLLAAVASVLVVFFAGAALAVRWAPSGLEVVPSPRDGTAMVLANWGAGRLVDTETGAALRRLPPPTYAAAWNDDGSVLAVATAGSTFGALERVWRVEFLGSGGETVFPPMEGSEDTDPLELVWSGKRVVALVSGSGERSGTGIFSCVPGEAPFRHLPYAPGRGTLRIVAGDADGMLLLHRAASDPVSSEPTKIVRMRWNGDDVEVVWERKVPYRSFLSPFSAPLSPSGRSLTMHVYEQVEDTESRDGRPDRVNRVHPIVLDLEDGTWTDLVGRVGLVAWIRGDRLAWVSRGKDETAVFTGTPGAEPTFRRAWARANVGISSSPDRRLLLVYVLPRAGEDPLPAFAARSFGPTPWREGDAPVPSGREFWLFDPSDSRWTRLPDDPTGPNDFFTAGWAGPRTTYRYTDGRIAFSSVAGRR